MSDNESPATLTPAQAWVGLLEGNARFVAGAGEHPRQDASRRALLAQGQSPSAVVLGCMDSRVPVEIVLDQGLGDLAVVRTAGQALDSAVLGSVEYGVAGLHAPLIVVLGHDSCGAVKATLAAHRSGSLPGSFIHDVVQRVSSSLIGTLEKGQTAHDVTPDALGEAHVRRTVAQLVERSPIIRDAVESGACAVVGAVYGLADGRMRVLETIGSFEDSPQA